MKKVYSILAAAMLVLSTVSASAQGGVIIKGGLTYGNITPTNLESLSGYLKDFNFKSFTGWHVGAGYQTDAVLGFSFQPELVFNVKGTKVAGDENMRWRMSYLELPVNIQWGIDLMVAKPFIFASPYVGYCVSNKVLVNDKSSIVASVITDELAQNAKRFEYGVGVGLGCNIARFQITAKYSWNFGAISSSDWMQTLKSGTAQGLEVSVGLRF